MFMKMHNCKKYSSMTETSFSSSKHPLHGNFDLVIGNRIVDYKTGRSNTLNEIKKHMDVLQKQDYFEFQPLIYLSLLRDNTHPPYRFSLVHVADNDVRSVTDEDFSINDNIRDVVLIQQSMRDFIADPDSPVKSKFGAASKAKIISGWSSFIDTAFNAGVDSCTSWGDDKALISSIADILGMGTKSGQEAIKSSLKDLSEIVSSGMFEDGTKVIVPSDTLERFLSIVDKDHDAASKQIYTEFPADPRMNCKKCSFFRVCTKDKMIELDEVDADE
jgi:hypothetical protein